MTDPLKRRAFLIRMASSGAALIPAAALVACGKELVCTDMAGLKPDEQEQRRQLKYVDATPEPAKRCDNCAAFKPAAPDACGACTELKGPVHPRGYCTVWRQS